MFRESKPASDTRLSFLLAGAAALVVMVVVDLAGSLILVPLLVLAPLITSSGGTRRATEIVAGAASIAAIALGWPNDIGGSRRHIVGMVTTIVGGALAVWLAHSRETRERRLFDAAQDVRRADRLKAALATGRMGEWSWDRRTGVVTWDSNTAALFGLNDDKFGGTYDEWLNRIDERDRQMVDEAVAAGIARRQPFRFDHRCHWPDGSVHWIEGVGEVVVDDHDEVVGAFGLAIDIDERHRQIEERNRLLEIEQRERERIEFLSKVNDVLAYSVDISEIVDRVCNALIPNLADWCSVVVSIDRRRERPLIKIAHRDPQRRAWAEQFMREHPYDPDMSWGAARVVKSGRRELIDDLATVVVSADVLDGLRAVGMHSAVTVPLVGALGTLGALQLIRGDDQPSFDAADLELIEELAGRLGSALNSAVLFDRQARGRAALDTLQQVSGRIASVATTAKIVHAALTYGAAGVRADGGALFLLDDDGELRVKESMATVDTDVLSAQQQVATQAMDSLSVVVTDFAVAGDSSDGRGAAALGVPLRIMNRIIGALVFTFDDEREFAPEDLSMLVTLGSRCAGALERASLYERDRDIALTFQRRLLPQLRRTPDWLDMAAIYRPATGMAIGGDWYQVLDVNDCVVAVVGDAVGHGLAAAAAMGQLRASIATAVATNADPDEAIAAVDGFAVQGSDTLGASLAYVLFEPRGPVRYISAGHVPMVWLPAATGRATVLEGGRRPLLGFRLGDDMERSDKLDFASGDLLVMFTDGLIERRGETLDQGLQRLVAAIETAADRSPQEIGDFVLGQLTGGLDVDDDIALLVIRRR